MKKQIVGIIRRLVVGEIKTKVDEIENKIDKLIECQKVFLESAIPTEMSHERCEEQYDFGIFGYWFSNNYGATLTSYALYKTVEKIGFSPVLIDMPCVIFGGTEFVRDENNYDRKFMRKNCNITPVVEPNTVSKLNNICKGYIIGSDSLWGGGWYDKIYESNCAIFLKFADGKDKISY